MQTLIANDNRAVVNQPRPMPTAAELVAIARAAQGDGIDAIVRAMGGTSYAIRPLPRGVRF